MDQKQKEQEIMDRYLELPEDVQKALFSTATSDTIFEVGKKHSLAIDKMGELADETGLVMLGITKPSEYIRNLEKRLLVPVLKAKEIAEDINQKVFSAIRESLKKIHGISPTPPVSKPPENLPVEKITLPKIPAAIPQKIIMPPQPDNIKVGEIAKGIEPRVEMRPMISGRIDAEPLDSARSKLAFQESEPYIKTVQPAPSYKKEEKTTEEIKPEIPDIFLKKIPLDSAQGKPKIENDMYKEQI